jgi:hypothetical protein
MMQLIGEEYEKGRFPRIETWTIDGLFHEQKLKFELSAVGLLTFRPDAACLLTSVGKDWIMWHRQPDPRNDPETNPFVRQAADWRMKGFEGKAMRGPEDFEEKLTPEDLARVDDLLRQTEEWFADSSHEECNYNTVADEANRAIPRRVWDEFVRIARTVKWPVEAPGSMVIVKRPPRR